MVEGVGRGRAAREEAEEAKGRWAGERRRGREGVKAAEDILKTTMSATTRATTTTTRPETDLAREKGTGKGTERR